MTEAEKWVRFFKMRTESMTQVEALRKIMRELESDYPHQLFNLVDGGAMVGSRRVFVDKSYCDMMMNDTQEGKITFGKLSDGLLGTAGNGRTIIH
jgi:hypothetical protein